MSANLASEDVRRAVRRLPVDVQDILQCLAQDSIHESPRLVLAGGYLRASIAGERTADIDLFAASTEWARSGTSALAGTRGLVVESENAATFKGSPVVQVIRRWTYENPELLLNSFDFTIARAAIWWDARMPSGGAWTSACDRRFYGDLAARRLHYCAPGDNTVGGTALRVLKFVRRGYSISPNTFAAVIGALVTDLPADKRPEIAIQERLGGAYQGEVTQ